MDEAEPTAPTQPDGLWMLRSTDIGKLVEALSKAQPKIEMPTKGRTAKIEGRANYSYSYADLADVIACYRAPLAEQGLVIAQTLRPQDGHLILLTTLMHSSGQWIGSEYPIQTYPRPQETGSAITYARRYCASAIIGIAAEDDDDGAAAQRAKPAEVPINADASAILDLALEIQQTAGGTVEEIVSAASFFGDDKGDHSFTDPTDKRLAYRPKWLASTRKRLEGQLHKIRMAAEPGAEEAAAALT
jgi:hypothetical protein